MVGRGHRGLASATWRAPLGEGKDDLNEEDVQCIIGCMKPLLGIVKWWQCFWDNMFSSYPNSFRLPSTKLLINNKLVYYNMLQHLSTSGLYDYTTIRLYDDCVCQPQGLKGFKGLLWTRVPFFPDF